jgi:hypothetical protein
MTKLTAEQIEYVEVFFGERALALRERIAICDYEDAEELALLEADITSLLNVEITEDPHSVYRALGVCDDRDGLAEMLGDEDEEQGVEIMDLVYNVVVFKEQA